LNLVAEKMTEIKGKIADNEDYFGLVASAKCTNEDNYVMQKFARAVMGTNNVDHCARLCHAPTVAGLVQSFGSGAMTNSIEEFKHSECFFAIGTNTTTAHPIIAMRINEAVKKGAKLIVANPREVELNRWAHLFLQFNPGTDVALMMGMAKIILDEGLADKKFIEERCENFEEFKESLNQFPLEKAEEIKVKLVDGREFDAKVVGRDSKTDLALIKISSLFKDLPILSLGDSDTIRVGDWVLAVGNPFGLEHTVTQGIISGRGRAIGTGPYDNFLQTDAPINPGNSGGPLVNLKGEVIGINSAIIASGQGIGFAIPINMAKSIISQLKESGKVTRGWIGVSIQTVTPDIAKAFGLKEATGALVGDVITGGPADSAGITRGDIIISFDGKRVKDMSDLPRIVAETPVGKDVDITIIRDGKEMNIKVKIEEMTEEKLAYQMQKREEKLGMTVDDITPQLAHKLNIKDKAGVVVIDIEPNSLADDAGMEAGDIIKEVNRNPIKNIKDYQRIMDNIGKDSSILFLVKRGQQTFYVSVKLS